MSGRSINYYTLLIFAPLLTLTGVAGFLLPPERSLTSAAMPYAIFHLIFGGLGIAALLAKDERWAMVFNLGFGLIDLYQALASCLDLFPERYFRWTVADDILHIVIGALLASVGLYGAFRRRHDARSSATHDHART